MDWMRAPPTVPVAPTTAIQALRVAMCTLCVGVCFQALFPKRVRDSKGKFN